MNNNYHILIYKLDAFIRKYYANRLIRGGLYSIALLGSFFLIFTLLESVAWFSSPVRTILFYTYLLSGLIILGYFVIIPVMNLMRAGKIISHEYAAQIIGHHFPDVKDSLLNVLQLNHLSESNPANQDLVLASINQKTERLKLIPFVSAIDLSQNKKYLAYSLPPVLILLAILFTSPSTITAPGSRIINHGLIYEKPLPFSIEIDNKELKAIQLEDFELMVSVKGEVLPEQLFIVSEGTELMMVRDSKLNFRHNFTKLQKTIRFSISAAGYTTREYELLVLPRPSILNFEAELNFPSYTGIPSEIIKNAGDFVVPRGTNVSWKFYTRDTQILSFKLGEQTREINTGNSNTFSTEAKILETLSYSISLSNEFLSGSDSMTFSITVIPDLHPTIIIEEFRDSVYDNRLYFSGLIKDDYGFSKLEFRMARVREDNTTSAEMSVPVKFEKSNTAQSFYHFFDISEAGLNPGEQVEYYFEVWDNDGIFGPKSARSQKTRFKVPTLDEINDMVKANQENVKSELEKSIDEARKIQKDIEQLQRNLFEKKNLNYQDKKQIEDLLKRQKKLKDQVEMMVGENEKSNQKESQYKEVNESIAEKQQQLQKLFEEIMSDEMKKLFEELQKMMEDIDKNTLDQVMDKMKFSAEDLEKALDRNLELFKQLEFEKKLTETIDNLKKLAEEQKKLSEKTNESKKDETEKIEEEQKKIEEDFKKIGEDLQDLQEKNKALEEPNKFRIPEEQKSEVQKEIENAKENLKKEQNKKASGNQKKASEAMDEMGNMLFAMQQEMEEEALGEDIEALRMILENLVQTSFDQESLMEELSKLARNDPRYGKITERQKSIKDNLLMIEDSLFALSKRQPMIESFVNREISAINQNVDQTMQALGQRSFGSALGKQQYVMTSVNNLALLLAESMKQMQQNMSMKSSGKSGKSCPMPGQGKPSAKSMRQMQEKLNQQMEAMKKSMEKGKNEQGKKGQGSMSEQFARMASEQAALRKQLQEYRDQMQKEGKLGDKGLNKMLQDMEQTETELVNKILNQQTMRRQEEILTRLLESEKAEMQREQEERRESNEARDIKRPDPSIFFKQKGLPTQETELLRTIPPSMNNYYRNKANEYFISIPGLK
ncbi:MAG: DUF4175 family protein [Lentimicrobium sp.]|nr:DUF4175 family protein [Lentimicrobium sp.]